MADTDEFSSEFTSEFTAIAAASIVGSATEGRGRLGESSDVFGISRNQSVSYTDTAGAIAEPIRSEIVRVLCTSSAYIAIGTNPTATASGIYIPALTAEYIAVTPGQRISAVRAAAFNGLLHVMECA